MLSVANAAIPPWDRSEFHTRTVDAALGWSVVLSVAENREAGLAAESFVERLFGPGKASRMTSSGMRFLDNLTAADGVARESKTGRTFLTRSVRRQIAKDVELLNTPGSGVKSIEWHFHKGLTGIGPSEPLRKALFNSGISIVEHR